MTLSINGIEDASGNVVAPQTTQFTTGTSADSVRPTVIATNVTAYGVTNVPTNAVFQVTFDEPMDVSTVLSQTTAFLYDYGSGSYRSGTGSMSSDGLTYTFVPNGVLAVNHQHSINMSLGFDLAGNQQDGYSLFFTTTFAGDTTPPTVTAVNPAAGAAAVPRNARIEIRFSEAISAISLGERAPAIEWDDAGRGDKDVVGRQLRADAAAERPAGFESELHRVGRAACATPATTRSRRPSPAPSAPGRRPISSRRRSPAPAPVRRITAWASTWSAA